MNDEAIDLRILHPEENTWSPETITAQQSIGIKSSEELAIWRTTMLTSEKDYGKQRFRVSDEMISLAMPPYNSESHFYISII
jgi:hypothetical protein